jgi:hypothetical protein
LNVLGKNEHGDCGNRDRCQTFNEEQHTPGLEMRVDEGHAVSDYTITETTVVLSAQYKTDKRTDPIGATHSQKATRTARSFLVYHRARYRGTRGANPASPSPTKKRQAKAPGKLFTAAKHVAEVPQNMPALAMTLLTLVRFPNRDNGITGEIRQGDSAFQATDCSRRGA